MIYLNNKNRKYPHQFFFNGYCNDEYLNEFVQKIAEIFPKNSYLIQKRNAGFHRVGGTHHYKTLFAFREESDAVSFKLTLADSFEPKRSVILPVLRRVMPTIIAEDIIGVSPMTGPSASIFSLRATYNTSMENDENDEIKKVARGKRTIRNKK